MGLWAKFRDWWLDARPSHPEPLFRTRADGTEVRPEDADFPAAVPLFCDGLKQVPVRKPPNMQVGDKHWGTVRAMTGAEQAAVDSR